mmetsp:Transcript_83531/g.259482  ORF Transcript_83531/g.259482 Transcript_83531/m.259482 type:complete len:211 (-) Transcript_83531:402-1034(-)
MSSSDITRMVRVPAAYGPQGSAWSPLAASRSWSASSWLRRSGTATTFGSGQSLKATSFCSPLRDPVTKSPRFTTAASSAGMSWGVCTICRISVTLKKQFTPYFTPLLGARPACSMRLSSTSLAMLFHMTAVPRRGRKLTPSTGKKVSPAASSSASSLRYTKMVQGRNLPSWCSSKSSPGAYLTKFMRSRCSRGRPASRESRCSSRSTTAV